MWTEAELKEHLKTGTAKPVYFLFGEESYLCARYAEKLAELALGGEADDFSCVRIDGQECTVEDIEAEAETLPMFAERKCVLVSDLDVVKHASDLQRLTDLLEDPPESCVLIFRLCGVQADVKKNAKWKAFCTAVCKHGAAVDLPLRTVTEATRMLCAGAKKRGSLLTPASAELLVARVGSDLNRLLCELDKLCAMADGGEITAELIRAVTSESLEAKVFDLSKCILQGNMTRAQEILRALRTAKEKPTSVLSVLSGAYVDLYRVKVAQSGGQSAESLSSVFNYRGREFVLRNAARDSARLSVETLRSSLEILAEADTTMKSSPVDKWLVLEKTAVELGRCLRS